MSGFSFFENGFINELDLDWTEVNFYFMKMN